MTTIVLTGVARRGQIGEALARHFAELGSAVVLLDRDGDEAERRAAELRASGHSATAFGVDLTEPDQLALVAQAVGRAADGQVAALVNAAGGFAMSGPVAASDPAIFHRQVAINLTSAYLATRAFLPLVRAARGSVVYFGSVAALPEGSPAEMAAYAAAKAGVIALMRAVAAEEAAHGVRANAVAPAAVRTADNLAATGDRAPYVERETVAHAVAWLCSAAARGVTGQVVRLSEG